MWNSSGSGLPKTLPCGPIAPASRNSCWPCEEPMIRRPARIRYRTICGLTLLMTSAGALAAQTHDESRLTLGMSAGYIGTAVLWDVANQPIISVFDTPD